MRGWGGMWERVARSAFRHGMCDLASTAGRKKRMNNRTEDVDKYRGRPYTTKNAANFLYPHSPLIFFTTISLPTASLLGTQDGIFTFHVSRHDRHAPIVPVTIGVTALKVISL